ncbi:MAG: hypothetical protein AB9834_00400 [Lentimicrobium sp.]
MRNQISQKDRWDTQINKIMSMQFVRIDFVLDIQYDILIQEFEELQHSRTGINDYQEYLRRKEDEKSIMAIDAGRLRLVEDKFEALNDEFHNRVGFLLQLPDNEVKAIDVILSVDAYLSIVEYLARYLVGEEISNFLMFGRYFAVMPSLVSHSRINEDDKNTILNKLEEVILNKIEGPRSGLSSEQHNNLIYLATHVVYCYSFYCRQYSIGTLTNVINYLFNMPRWIGTPYLNIEHNIKLNFSLLCLHLSFDLFKWNEHLVTKIGVSITTYNNLRFIFGNTLQMLQKHNTSYYILVFQWFISRIDSDITYYYADNPKLEYHDLHDIDRIRILSCCEKFSNYRYPVTIESVVRFLQQFKDRKDAEAVLRILDAIDFLEFWQLAERLEDALQQMKNRDGDLAICPLGPVSGSTALMHYYIAHSGIKGLSFFNSVTEAIQNSEKQSVICFIDDCALTGIQSRDIFQTLMGIKKPTNNEMLVLSGNERTEFLRRKVGMCLSIISDTAFNDLKSTFKSLNLNNAYTTYGSMTLEKEKTFSPASRVSWKDINERKHMSLIFQRIGMRLLSAKAKEMKWSREEIKRHSLGYGDFQRLIVFPYSVPKPTLIALWAGKRDFSSSWVPLFPLVVQDDNYYPVQ